MRSHIADYVDDLIYTYNLHAGLPVDLSPLEALFVPTRRSLAPLGLVGMAILPKGKITPENFAQIVLDDSLAPYDERIVYAHEVGHCIHNHEGFLRFHFGDMDDWFADRMEREAWKIAVRLLVPSFAINEFGFVDAIAGACEVPPKLVRLSLQ